MNFNVRNIAELRELAENKILPILKDGMTVALIGELGAGKTTLVREIVALLGGTEPVSSPTFVLMHEYQTPRFLVEHWDLYRLNELPEDLHERAKSVRFVEWADRAAELVADIKVAFQLFPDKRVVSITF